MKFIDFEEFLASRGYDMLDFKGVQRELWGLIAEYAEQIYSEFHNERIQTRP